jgi:hypothetical protein
LKRIWKLTNLSEIKDQGLRFAMFALKFIGKFCKQNEHDRKQIEAKQNEFEQI